MEKKITNIHHLIRKTKYKAQKLNCPQKTYYVPEQRAIAISNAGRINHKKLSQN